MGIDRNGILFGSSIGLELLPIDVARALTCFGKFGKLASLSIVLDILEPCHTNGNFKRAEKFDHYRTIMIDSVLKSMS